MGITIEEENILVYILVDIFVAKKKSVMLVWLQDTILSYGKRLKVS